MKRNFKEVVRLVVRFQDRLDVNNFNSFSCVHLIQVKLSLFTYDVSHYIVKCNIRDRLDSLVMQPFVKAIVGLLLVLVARNKNATIQFLGCIASFMAIK